MMLQVGQDFLQLEEEAFAGASRSGYMWKLMAAPSRPPRGEEFKSFNNFTSLGLRRVAEGMARALWPAESIAQQSEQPSVM